MSSGTLNRLADSMTCIVRVVLQRTCFARVHHGAVRKAKVIRLKASILKLLFIYIYSLFIIAVPARFVWSTVFRFCTAVDVLSPFDCVQSKLLYVKVTLNSCRSHRCSSDHFYLPNQSKLSSFPYTADNNPTSPMHERRRRFYFIGVRLVKRYRKRQ